MIKLRTKVLADYKSIIDNAIQFAINDLIDKDIGDSLIRHITVNNTVNKRVELSEMCLDIIISYGGADMQKLLIC